ncbi:MAG: ABC transporter permease [Candidatus Helarchaeota archaeon]|nr:ABC transporter permease [Candidatus Helarchaeota archaeon]
MVEFDLHAIIGIVKRDMIKYFRNKQMIISSLIMPAIFMLFLRPGFAGFAGGGEPEAWIMNYLGAGIICMVIIMSGIMMSGMPVLFDKMLGFQDIYAVAPVKRRNLVLGFLIGGALKSLFMSSVVIVIGLATGLYPNMWGLGWVGSLLSIIPLTFTIFFGAIIYACIGLIIAARTDMTNAFLWNNLINMPLIFVSGAIIPIHTYGETAKYALLCNPTTYMADAIRVWLGGEIGPAGTGNEFFGGNLLLGYAMDMAILAFLGIILFYLAFRVFGGSLQESSGGFAGMIHKKSAKAREKMFKDLEPADRDIMMKVTNKIDMMKMGQIMGLAGDGKQDEAMKMLKDAGISDEDIKGFFAAGMRMMELMMKKQKK